MSKKQKNKQQIVAITGATATGKSSLAIKLAEELVKKENIRRVFLLSVDSRQVYQGFEILSAADIPHGWRIVKDKPYRHFAHPQLAISLHGTSIIPIWQEWSPAHFRKLYLSLKEKLNKDDLLILVGGTGFYHKQISQPAETLNLPPNPSLRKELSKKSLNFLQEQLKQLNLEKFEAMNSSDSQNPRRLIRAIEVAKAKKKNDKETRNIKREKSKIINIHLILDAKKQQEQIKRRVADRFKHALHEVRAALNKYKLSPELPAASTIGFQELYQYLDHQLSAKKALLAWQRAEIQYSKRQNTWWKKAPNLLYLQADDPQLFAKALRLML
jgi:tRNA dimethylallyltransferase